MKLPDSYWKYLDEFEQTDFYKAVDAGWIDIMLSDALERYEVEGPQFALFLLDIGRALQAIVQQVYERDELYHAETDRGCEVGLGLSEFVVKMTAMAAVATREARGKDPICLIPDDPSSL